jgi:hypothetical protein
MTTTGAGGVKGFWALDNTRPDSLVAKGLLLVGGTYAAYKLLPVINTIVLEWRFDRGRLRNPRGHGLRRHRRPTRSAARLRLSLARWCASVSVSS